MKLSVSKKLGILGFVFSFFLFGCGSPTDNDKAVAYVSTQKGNVVVIDLETMQVTGEVDVGGQGPRGIGVTSDGGFLITANGDAGDIAVMERGTGELVKRIPIGENPEFVRVLGNKVFVSFEPAAIGGPPPKPGSDEAKALAKEREEEEEEPAEIAIVDLNEMEMTRSIVGGMETEGIGFSADKKNILVTNEADENITVHNIESGELVKTVSTKAHGYRPRGIKMAPSGTYYVGSLEYGNSFVVLNEQYELVNTVKTGEVPYGLAFNNAGDKLFVALNKGAALEVFDTSTWEVVKRVPTGKRCWHFTFTPDDSHILVACGRSDEVIVIDSATLEEVSRVSVPGMPWGIITYPKAMGSLDAPD